MKQVSIQDLKARLSSVVAEAASGHTIVITRHNEPVARLSPAHATARKTGRVSLEPLKPAIRGGTKGRALEALMEDRGNR